MSYRLIHDDLLDHPALRGVGCRSKPYSDCEAFIWLIHQARREPGRVPVGDGYVELKIGELTHSFRYMANAWKWDLNKVRRFLDKLKRCSMIDTAISCGQLLIRLCKFREYQRIETPAEAPTDTVEKAEQTHYQHKNHQVSKKEERESDDSLYPPTEPAEWPEPAPAEPAVEEQLDLVDFIAEHPPAPEPEPAPVEPVEPCRTAVEPEILPPEESLPPEVGTPSRCKPTGDPGFDQFYAAYPLHKAPKDARRAYRRIIRSGEATHAELMAGVARYTVETADKEPRHIKHPATWLNAGCWNDEPDPVPALPNGYRHERNRTYRPENAGTVRGPRATIDLAREWLA